MAHQDDTAGSGLDDWFDDPAVLDSVPSRAPSSERPGRRLTVLSQSGVLNDQDAEPDDGWFDDDSAEPDHTHIGDTHFPAARATARTRTTVHRGARSTSRQSSTRVPALPNYSWWKRHRSAVAVTAALAVVIGGGGGAAALLTHTSEPPTSPPLPADQLVVTTAGAPTSAPAAAAADAAAANVTWCAGQAAGDPVTENSADPGATAIWRFEKAFYYDRDGVAARAAGAPDAVMASAQRLQAGIDQLEPDIEFCVLADPIDTGIYDVTVVERGPGIDGRISRQRITTTPEQPGGVLISAIVPR